MQPTVPAQRDRQRNGVGNEYLIQCSLSAGEQWRQQMRQFSLSLLADDFLNDFSDCITMGTDSFTLERLQAFERKVFPKGKSKRTDLNVNNI